MLRDGFFFFLVGRKGMNMICEEQCNFFSADDKVTMIMKKEREDSQFFTEMTRVEILRPTCT